MRTFMLFLIGLTFGAAGGFLVAAGNGITLDGHDHTDPSHHSAGMGDAPMAHGSADHQILHNTPIVLDAATAPTLALMIGQDPMAGYNLHVTTERFIFAPDAASMDHVEGQGHAHVHVNGVKLARLYGPWMHLEKLPKGNVEITVSLTSNDHRPFMVDGAVIEATRILSVK